MIDQRKIHMICIFKASSVGNGLTEQGHASHLVDGLRAAGTDLCWRQTRSGLDDRRDRKKLRCVADTHDEDRQPAWAAGVSRHGPRPWRRNPARAPRLGDPRRRGGARQRGRPRRHGLPRRSGLLPDRRLLRAAPRLARSNKSVSHHSRRLHARRPFGARKGARRQPGPVVSCSLPHIRASDQPMSHLFDPIVLGGVEFANRIAVSPMCQYSADDGSANDWHLQHLGALSMSGAGLLIVEMTGVEPEGRITPHCLGLYSDANEAALARVVALSRRWGAARLGIQLAHAGRKASSRVPWQGGTPVTPDEGGWQTTAPSAIPVDADRPAPRALDEAGLTRIRDAFVAATKRVVRLGFDLLELHGAHGYLLHNFVSPLSNRRSDGYGGSLTNRMRFPLEVATAVRD